MQSTEKFIRARDFLIANRENYAVAYGEFRWPVLEQFNWALDYFDVYARDKQRPALWVVNDGGGESRLTFAKLSERSNRVANFL
ncbi:MAG: AMP-dependent synthetase, partial [Chloroflexi bacterium]|nr:AMP-dependent synthetase [Chloroflexota bacterium]